MKFDYCRDSSGKRGFYPVWNFHFTLDEDEVRKVVHKYGYPLEDSVGNSFISSLPTYEQMLASLRILQESATDTVTIDLGTNYKEKYEELVELLKPYKIDEDMSPATTLKMILKYHK